MIIEFYINIKFEKKKENAAGHTTHTGRRGNLARGAARPWTTRRGAGGAVARSGEGGGAAACSGGRRGRRRRGRARGVEAGAASRGGTGPGPGWRRQRRRRSQGRRRSVTLGSRGGALGGDVDGGGARGARAVGAAGERTAAAHQKKQKQT